MAQRDLEEMILGKKAVFSVHGVISRCKYSLCQSHNCDKCRLNFSQGPYTPHEPSHYTVCTGPIHRPEKRGKKEREREISSSFRSINDCAFSLRMLYIGYVGPPFRVQIIPLGPTCPMAKGPTFPMAKDQPFSHGKGTNLPHGKGANLSHGKVANLSHGKGPTFPMAKGPTCPKTDIFVFGDDSYHRHRIEQKGHAPTISLRYIYMCFSHSGPRLTHTTY